MIRNGMDNVRIVMLVIVVALTGTMANAQGRLVLNGGKVNITNGAVLVVSNASANAITRTSGHIISEGENNRIRWNIGTTAGSYTIPWGAGNSNYFPVSFNTSAAGGAGFFYFATMSTAAENSTSLPTGVTHFNGAAGDDMSLVAVDRFWKMDAQSYTTRPTLTNLIFTYQDAEFAAPNKTTVENKLTARRWNSVSNTWTDYNTGGTVNTTANTITVASLTGTNLYPWWTMAYPGAAFHWIPATTANWNSAANWSATAGGAGGLGVPGPGDAVWFDDVRDAGCNLNVAADVARITMSTGYSGTVTQGNNTISIANQADLAAGTFTGGNATMTVNGNLNLSGVAFTAPATILDVKQHVNFTAGTFNHNNGTVRFSGTKGTQLINGSVAATFNNINVTNTSANPGLRIESNTNLAGVMSLNTNVTVDADGASDNRVLTLLSTSDSPTQDAAIGILPAGASVTGRVTVQRYMSLEGANTMRIYRYIGSPVQRATVADLQQEISITGTFTGTSSCKGCGNNQSMFSYQESIITDNNGNGINTADDGYIDFPANSNLEELEPGRGYTFFVRGNIMTSAKWDVRGVINAGNVTPINLPVTYTSSGQVNNDGWNLVANPFPSTIDWSAASGWTKTNIDGAIYTRDNGDAISRYAAWNGVLGTNGGSRYIATGQAFWVKATGSGTPVLRANENIKAAGTQATFFREKALTDVFRITLIQGANSDEAVVHFRDDASEEFDAAADARKMPNGGINLSTQLAGKEKLAINSLAKSSCNTTLTVLVENATKGNYSFNFSDLETFPGVTSILLTDNFTGTTVDTRAQKSYAFSITTDPLSAGSSRFSLAFSSPVPKSEFSVSTPAVCMNNDGEVILTGTNSENTYDVFMGKEQLAFTEDGTSGSISWNIAKEKLQIGDNAMTVRAMPLVCGLPNEKKVTLEVVEIASPTSVTPGSVCREGQIQLSSADAGKGSAYRWYENQLDVTPLKESATADFTTPLLTESKTYYVSIVNALGCEGDRVAVAAEVVRYNDAQITFSNDSLHVNFQEGVQWYFNDEELTANTEAIHPEAFGTYSVLVTIGSCITESTYEHVDKITGVEIDIKKAIRVYPNPVVNELFLEVPAQIKHVQYVTVRNELGQYIGQFKLKNTNGITTGTFNMTAQSAGMYTVEITTEGKSIPLKVVKN